MNYRIKQLIIFFLPVIFIGIIIVFIKDWNRGSIVINNAKNSIISIKQDQYEIDNEKYEIELWPDSYSINIKKTGYFDINQQFKIERGKEINFYPEFVLIPTIQRIYAKKPYTISEENQLISNKENVYKDNQENIQHLKLDEKSITNLPKDIFYILFSPNGQEAIIITSDSSLDLFTYYHFNTNSEELSVFKQNTKLSGLSWNKLSSAFTYYEKLNETEGRIMTYNIKNKKAQEVTRIYDTHNMVSNFALNDKNIVSLPIYANKDVILSNIGNARKEKLTNSANIDRMKVSYDGSCIFYKKVEHNKDKISYLDLKTKQLTQLPDVISNLDTIELLGTTNKILFATDINSPFDSFSSDEEDKNTSIFNTFDLNTWKITTIRSPGLDNTQVEKFITLYPEKRELIFKDDNEDIYRFMF